MSCDRITSEMATCSHEYAAQVAVKHADLIGQWKILSLKKSDTASVYCQTKTCHECELGDAESLGSGKTGAWIRADLIHTKPLV